MQGVLIAIAAVVGVYAAEFTLREVLLKRALMDEAQHFWRRHAEIAGFPLPDTRNLTGFMRRADGSGEVPAAPVTNRVWPLKKSGSLAMGC